MNLKKFISYLAIFSIFTEAFTCKFLIFSDFKIYNFILGGIIIILFLLLDKVYFNKIFIFLFFIIIYFSLCNIILNNTSILSVSKQLIGIFIHSLVFYLLIRLNQEDVKKLFLIYFRIAFVVALIGLVQEIAYILKLEKLFNFSYIFPNWSLTKSEIGLIRVNSIMPEASSFCMVMLPAFFASCASFIDRNFNIISRVKSFIIIASFILTFSMIGFIGILCTLLILAYKYLRRRYVVLLCIMAIVLVPAILRWIPEYRLRVMDTFYAITGKKELNDTNQTTYTFLRNAAVAFDSFRSSCLFGRGLGSHKLSYDKYVKEHGITHPSKILVLNKEDANSLFLRLLSETGLLGLIIFLVFMFRYYIGKGDESVNYLWIISNSVFILFIIRLIRQGHYFSEGFFFFFWLYYFTKEKNIREAATLQVG